MTTAKTLDTVAWHRQHAVELAAAATNLPPLTVAQKLEESAEGRFAWDGQAERGGRDLGAGDNFLTYPHRQSARTTGALHGHCRRCN